ncbi:hypothetical protein [Photobacterium sp. R1]
MNDWQEPLLGILVYCVVSLTTVLQCALSPERQFQLAEAAPGVQQQDDGAWTQIFDAEALAQLSVSERSEKTAQPLWQPPELPVGTGGIDSESAGVKAAHCLRSSNEATGAVNLVF